MCHFYTVFFIELQEMYNYVSVMNISTVYYNLLTIYTIDMLGKWPMHVVQVDLIGNSNYIHVYTLRINDHVDTLIAHTSLSVHPLSFIKRNYTSPSTAFAEHIFKSSHLCMPQPHHHTQYVSSSQWTNDLVTMALAFNNEYIIYYQMHAQLSMGLA